MSENTPFTGHQTIDEDTLKSASQIMVFDSQGNKHPFGEIFASSKTIVVFIRKCIHTFVLDGIQVVFPRSFLLRSIIYLFITG